VTFENDVNAGCDRGILGNSAVADRALRLRLDRHRSSASGILIDGKILRGAFQAAGEVGYLPLGADPFSPLNVERGALESSLGAAGIAARYHLAGGQAGTSVRDIFERYNAGERPRS
jgi:predicted NBD/HSP70 family sugar kinase